MKIFFGVTAVCAALLVPASSTARQVYVTGLTGVQSTPLDGNRVLWSGAVESEKAKCVRNRRLEASINEGSGFVVHDTGLSTRRGGWGLIVDDVPGDIRIKAFAKDAGDDRCQAASLTMG